ncbi:MAG: response regulator [Candidatus Omnitrophica bacterium]|nr:response regulator [Candidatus Omnitrophota bacterium]
MNENQKKIIVADDNEEICKVLKGGLADAGYSVDSVGDGFALVAYLKENQDIDAILLDLVMPQKGGISVFETVRSISPASKLIIYTGYEEYRNSVYGREADAFVLKTEGMGRILDVLEDLL